MQHRRPRESDKMAALTMTSDRVSICSNIAAFALARYESFSCHPGTLSDGRNAQQQELTVRGEPAHFLCIKNEEGAHSVGLKSQEPVFCEEPGLEPGVRGRRAYSDQRLTYMGLLLGCSTSFGHEGTLLGGESKVERKGGEEREGGGGWESEENRKFPRLAKAEVRRKSASFIEEALDELITSKADCTSIVMEQKEDAPLTIALEKRPFHSDGALSDAALNSFAGDKNNNNNSFRQSEGLNLLSAMTFSHFSGSYSPTSQTILPPVNSSGNVQLASSSSSSSSSGSHSSSSSSDHRPCSIVRPFHSLGGVALDCATVSVTLARHGSGCHIISSPGETAVSLTTMSTLPSAFSGLPYQLPVPVCDSSSLSFQPSDCHSPFARSNTTSPSSVASVPVSTEATDSDGAPTTLGTGRLPRTHPGCSTIKYNRRKGRTGASASQEEEEEQNRRRIHFCDYPSKLYNYWILQLVTTNRA